MRLTKSRLTCMYLWYSLWESIQLCSWG